MAALPLPRHVIDTRLAAVAAHHGNQVRASEALGIPRSTLQATIATAKRLGLIPARPVAVGWDKHPGRIDLDIKDGIILVGSDAHIWPGAPTTAMFAFEQAVRHFRSELRAVVLNGDSLDAASIGRHPRIGWEDPPRLADELAAVQAQKRRLRRLGGDDPAYIWPIGNHDMRFETAISNGLPQLQDVTGTKLRDHFPDWRFCWNLVVNDELVIRHRLKGGVHAAHNNTITAGKSIATGHLHSLKVAPWTDYNGTRWGIDTGTLATPYGPQFHYTEGGPLNWRAGFVVLTFYKGALLQPELVLVRDEHSWEFRGRVYRRPG